MTRTTLSILAIMLMVVPASASYGQTDGETNCDNPLLETAQSRYDLGLFVEVLDVLDPCVPGGFGTAEQRTVAYRLMALSHIAMDSDEEARQWTRQLLEQDPDYRVSPEVDPPRFAGMVDDLQPRWYTWLWKGNEWYKWAGRTAIVGTAVAVPLLLRDSPEPDLPLPPALPAR